MKKSLSVLVLALVIFAAIGAGAHYHKDGKLHDDCPVCVASNHMPAISGSYKNLSYIEIVLTFEASENVLYLSLTDKAYYPTRAPPTETVLS